MIKTATEAPEGSAKYARDPVQMQLAMDALYKTRTTTDVPIPGTDKTIPIPLVKEASAAMFGTAASSMVGAFLGGAEGAVIAGVFMNPSGRRLFTEMGLVAMGLAPETVRKLGAVNYYQRQNATFEHTVKVMAEGNARKDAYSGRSNPASDILSPHGRSGDYYEADMYAETLGRLGISMGDAIQQFADLTIKNRESISSAAAAIARNRASLETNVSAGRLRSASTTMNLESLTGRETIILKSKGYREVKANFDVYVNNGKITQTEADVQLAKLRVMAIASDNPGTFFDGVTTRTEYVDNIIEAAKKRMAENKQDDLSVEEMYQVMKDFPKGLLQNRYADDAYYKSIGLYDFINGKKKERISIADIQNYKKEFESHGFVDDIQSELFELETKDFRSPSAAMDDFLVAEISIDGKNLQVYYKLENNKLSIGEIHHGNVDATLDVNLRVKATKVLISRKMIDGAFRFEWDPDLVFYQFGDIFKKSVLENSKKSYNQQINQYLNSFQKSFDQVKKLNEKPNTDVTERKISAAISKSVQDYLGMPSKDKVASIRFVSSTPDLSVHSTTGKNNNPQQIVDTIDQSLKELKSADIALEKLQEVYDSKQLKKEIGIFKGIKDIAKFIGTDRTLLYANKEKRSDLVKGYRERLKKAADKDAELQDIKNEMTQEVDILISQSKRRQANNKSRAENMLRKSLRDIQVQDPSKAAEIADYIKDSTADAPDVGFNLDDLIKLGTFEVEPFVVEPYTPDMGIKMYRGKSASDRIVESGSKTLEFRKARIGSKSVLILEQIMDRADADKRSIHDINYDLSQARAARDADKTAELTIELVKKRKDVSGNAIVDSNINDIYGEERMALRQVLTVDELFEEVTRDGTKKRMIPDAIGYHADNLEYGSAIRSELEMAGIPFTEKMVKEKDGTTYRYIEISKKARSKLKKDALPVLDFERRSASMILFQASKIERQLDLVSGELPPVGSLDDYLIEESIVLSDGSRMNRRVLDNTRRWMGIKDVNSPDKVKKAIGKFRSRTETITDDIYGGYTVQELAQMVDEKQISKEKIKDVESYLLDGDAKEDRTKAGGDIRTLKFKDAEKEYPYSVEVMNGSLVISNANKLLREHVSSILYQAAQEGFERVIFVDASQRSKFYLDKFSDDWEMPMTTYRGDVPGTWTKLGLVDDVSLEITEQMYASVPEKKSRLFRLKEEELGGVFDFKIPDGADLHSFMEMNANNLIDMMDEADYNALTRYFESVERADGKRVLTRRGRKDMAMVYSYAQRAEGLSDLELKELMNTVKDSFKNMTYYVFKERMEDPIKGSSKVPLSEAMLHRNFDSLQVLEGKALAAVNDELIMNSLEVSKKIEGPILRGIEGLQKTSAEKGVPLSQTLRKTARIQIQTDPVLRQLENKTDRALGEQRQKAMRSKMPFDNYLFDIRPSNSPFAINNVTALKPEKTRAARDKAKRILAERGLDAEKEVNIKSVIDEEGFHVTAGEIDRAFFDLVEEGGGIDIQDLLFRNIGHVKMLTAMQSVKADFTALASRTIVRADDAEMYSQLAHAKVMQLFGVDNMRSVAKLFGDYSDIDMTRTRGLEDLRGRNQLKASITDAKVVARLQMLVNDVRGTPGGNNLPFDLRERIKNPVDGSVNLYFNEMAVIRDAIIDNSVVSAGRRNHTVETANRHAVYAVLSFLAQSFPGKAGRAFLQNGLDRISDGLMANYNPSMMKTPFSKKPEPYAPNVRQLIESVAREFKAFPRDVQKLISLLTEEASAAEIKQASDMLGDNALSYMNPKFDKYKPAMLFIIQAMRRKLHDPVDPIHIPYLQNLYHRLHSTDSFIDSLTTDLNSMGTVPQMKIMIERLTNPDEITLDDAQKANINLLQQFVDDPKIIISEAKEKKVRKALKEINNTYAETFKINEVLTLNDLKDQLKDIQVMFNRRGKSQRETDAIEFLLVEFNKGYDLTNLTDEQVLSIGTQVSIIYSGINSRYRQVQQTGMSIFKSVHGTRNLKVEDAKKNALAAYTLFYTGRITMGDQDITKMQNRGVFDVSKPPNGVKWRVRDLELIAVQYGLPADSSSTIRQLIRSRFGGPAITDTMEAAEIVELANRIVTEPNKGMFNNLLQLARDQGSNRLFGVGQDDVGLITFEMIIRLMAEEKISNLAKSIAETHVYGDLREVSRNKLVEMGYNPITKEDELIDRVQEKLNNYLMYGDSDILYNDNGSLIRDFANKDDAIEMAAFEIANEITIAYGLIPNTITNVDEGVQRYVAPDGQEYLIPQQMIDDFETIVDDVAPSGKAKLQGYASFSDISERKENLKRLRQSYAIAEEAEEHLIKVLRTRRYEGEDTAVTTVGEKRVIVEALSKDQARKIARQYILETHPDYNRTKARASEMASGMADIDRETMLKEGIETRLDPEILIELEQEFEAFLKSKLSEQIKKDSGLLNRLKFAAKDFIKAGVPFKQILSMIFTPWTVPGRAYKALKGETVRITPEIRAILDKTGMKEAIHTSDGLEKYIAKYNEEYELGLGTRIEELAKGTVEENKYKVSGDKVDRANLIDQFVRVNYERLRRFAVNPTEIDLKFNDTSGITSKAAEYIGAMTGMIRGQYDYRTLLGRPYNLMKKQAVTTGFILPNPGYYINNMIGAVAQAYMQGGVSGISDMAAAVGRNPVVYTNALRYLHKGSVFGLDAATKSKSIMITRDGRMFTAETLADSADRNGIGASFIKAELARAIGDDIRRTDPNRWMATGLSNLGGRALNDMYLEWAQTTDNFYRLAMYMDNIHKGLSEAEAARIVRTTFYDYADLSELEKSVLRELFLFYAYSRKNQIQIFRTLATNPSRFMGQLRMIKNSQKDAMGEEDPRMLNDWMSLRYMISGRPIRFAGKLQEHQYKDKYGRKVYLLSQFGVQDGAEILAPLMSLIPGSNTAIDTAFADFARYASGQTGPLLKFIIEITSQEDTFMGMDLEQMRISDTIVNMVNDTGIAVFSTASHSQGFVGLKLVATEYNDELKRNENFYRPMTGTDVLKLYIIMDLTESLPGATTISGRGKKFYNDFLYSIVMGDKFEMMEDMTILDYALRGTSVDVRFLDTTEQRKARELRDVLYEFKLWNEVDQ